MKKDFLLKTKGASTLYEVAKELPLIDYHNHLSVSDLKRNRKFNNIYELWLECDPYKHRLMRISGVPEKFITKDSSPFEKFESFCTVFPYLAGNPVYDWARMELSFIFGIDEIPCKDNARYLFDKCGEMLSSDEFSAGGILSRFNVEYQSPVASILDDLSDFDGASLAPSLRADGLLDPSEKLKSELSSRTGIEIIDENSYLKAIGLMLDRFEEKGCRFADHSLDADFFSDDRYGDATRILTRLSLEYRKRGWTLLLHLDAKRNTSPRLAEIAGPAGGYAGVGGRLDVSTLTDMLGNMEAHSALPDTVLFPLNMNDHAPLSVLQGSFSEDGVASKVQLGPAWWWCDHAHGIENMLDSISSFGVLSQFIGMTTDSRSILSFIRHDYFRRILCSYLDRRNEIDELDIPFNIRADIVKKICYENAKAKIERKI